jgi:TatD DNase family protein
MDLAKRLRIPVIIHDRDAHGDCLEVIKEYPEVIGVFHSYSGSAEMVRELVKLGWYISFSGTVTFKNARVPKEACVVVPSDRLLIETDAPYLAPTPHRGTLNRSTYVQLTAEEIARLRGTTLEEIEKITTENAKRLFGIK